MITNVRKKDGVIYAKINEAFAMIEKRIACGIDGIGVLDAIVILIAMNTGVTSGIGVICVDATVTDASKKDPAGGIVDSIGVQSLVTPCFIILIIKKVSNSLYTSTVVF